MTLVLCGLPSPTGNIHASRTNAERLFRAEESYAERLVPYPEIRPLDTEAEASQ